MTPSPWQASHRPPLTLNEKRPGPEAARLRLRQHREQLADEGEQPGVGRRVRSRRPADRRLIDLDHLVELLDALDGRVRARFVGRAVEHARERSVENLVDERRLARSADAGDRRQHAERERDVDVLEVVRARALDDDLRRASRAGGTPASRSCVRRAGTRRSASRGRPAAASAGVPWKITWPPCSPAPRPRSMT